MIGMITDWNDEIIYFFYGEQEDCQLGRPKDNYTM